MLAIRTKRLGPTDTKGTRVKAYTDYSSVTIPWDYESDVWENHMYAAKKLIDKKYTTLLLAHTRFVCGWTKGGYVFVLDDGIGDIEVE